MTREDPVSPLKHRVDWPIYTFAEVAMLAGKPHFASIEAAEVAVCGLINTLALAASPADGAGVERVLHEYEQGQFATPQAPLSWEDCINRDEHEAIASRVRAALDGSNTVKENT